MCEMCAGANVDAMSDGIPNNTTTHTHIAHTYLSFRRISLTVEPFRIVFQCPFEIVLLPAGRHVVQIGAEYHRVGLGELGIRAGILQRVWEGDKSLFRMLCEWIMGIG